MYIICAGGDDVSSQTIPIARYTDDEPDDWDDEMGLFHKNESSWCSGTVFDHLSRVEILDQARWSFFFNAYKLTDSCPCFHWTLKLDKQN